jgi:hypothetical protein
MALSVSTLRTRMPWPANQASTRCRNAALVASRSSAWILRERETGVVVDGGVQVVVADLDPLVLVRDGRLAGGG